MKLCPYCELNWIHDDEIGCSVCKPKPETLEQITSHKDLGGNSKEIYTRLCNAFGWNKAFINNFGYQRPLYAPKVDAERKRDVWFIFHSNLNENSVAENGKHLNIIKNDTIAEYYEDAHRDTYPLADRIVFAKEKDGGYKFLGVYRAVNPNSRDQGRLYKRISEVYPCK